MKFLLLILMASLLSTQAYAFTYGKFKLSVGTGFYDAEEIIFLMNSAGKVKILENDDYYEIDSSLFFSEVTLSIQSGGDEDFVVGSITLKDNVILDSCASFVDAKNEYLMRLSPSSLKLERWNKYKKKYVAVPKAGAGFSEACFSDLLSGYDFEEEI